MFLTSYKITTISNSSYTKGEYLVYYKLLYTVQSIELEVSKMNQNCTGLENFHITVMMGMNY